MVMSRGKLLRKVDQRRIQEAIREAEKRTSGEIRVSVSSLIWGDVRKAAEKAFVRMGMAATTERNAVLFFVVPARRKFVVLGDTGIHQKAGQEFWHHIARLVSDSFRQANFTDGLVRAIETVGAALASHFPRDANQPRGVLPDDVDYGAENSN